MSVLGLLLLAPDPAIYAGGVGVVFSLVLAAGCAALLTRSWREHVSLWKRRIVMLALSLVFLLFIPVAGSILMLSYTYGHFSLSEPWPKTWLWHAPEVLRAPIARNLARWSKQCDYFVYASGLASAGDLKARALAGVTSSKKRVNETEWAYNWRSWSERDGAGALAAALAVPAVSGSPAIPMFVYDFGAGFIVGLYGDDETVRQRLKGNYSNQFTAGMIVGLDPSRLQNFSTAIETVLAARNWDRRERWEFSPYLQNHHLHNALLKMIQSASPLSYANLESALQNFYWRDMNDIRIAALQSPDPMVRKLILYSTYYSIMVAQELRLMLACAEGQAPGADADERRAAAIQLRDYLNQQFPDVLTVSFNVDYGLSPLTAPPAAPLSPQEEQEIDAICAKAKELLSGERKP